MRINNCVLLFLLCSLWVGPVDAFSELWQDQQQNNGEESDFEQDFDCISALYFGFKRVVDAAGMFLGYDTASFIQAREYLACPNVRLELILAILIAKKYPKGDFLDSLANFFFEIDESGMFSGYDGLIGDMAEMIDMLQVQNIVNVLGCLSAWELKAVVGSLCERRPFISFNENKAGRWSREQQNVIARELKAMIKDNSH